MHSLLWKEWHEQSWKLGFGCVVLGALALIGLHSRIIADEVDGDVRLLHRHGSAARFVEHRPGAGRAERGNALNRCWRCRSHRGEFWPPKR